MANAAGSPNKYQSVVALDATEDPCGQQRQPLSSRVVMFVSTNGAKLYDGAGSSDSSYEIVVVLDPQQQKQKEK